MAEVTGAVGASSLHPGDIVVIVGYFAFVLFVGLWTSRRNRGSAGGYFLAGRNMHWIPVGASLFASNIGSLHFVGLAGSGAANGIAIALYEINAMFVVLLLGYIFLPIYISSGIYTMPEYLQRRFGGKRIQMYMALLALLVYIFTKISADLYAGALFIEQAIGWNIYPAILLLLAIAAVFTITGGLTAVIWTDLIQTIIMLIGAFVLMVISMDKVGGLNGLVTKYPKAISNSSLHSNNTCGKPRADYWHMMRDPLDGDLPWPGLVGLTVNSVWYWCADQVIVQRSLAGKTYDHSKMGCILAGYLKVLPMFLLVLPGMIARVLFTETVGCSDPEMCLEVCGSRTGCSNIAYPVMVLNLLPAGARGMMLAVMLSALMSSLTSIFNSSATIFAMDMWPLVRKRASELEVMVVGRVFVVVLVVVSIIWVPVLQASQGSQLFVYIQEVSSFLQPPICAVFLLAIFWPRFNEKGAFVALTVGMAVGLVRFAVQYAYTVPDCGSAEPDPTPLVVKNVHYLYFSALLWVLTLTVGVVTTLLTQPMDPRCVERLTWWSRNSTQPCWDVDQWSRDPKAYEEDRLRKPLSPLSDVIKPVTTTTTTADGETGATRLMTSEDDDAGRRVQEELELDPAGGKMVVVVEAPSVTTRPARSVARRAVEWVCGIDGDGGGSAATHTVQKEDMVSIQEERVWKIVSNSLAVILVFTGTFLMVFFA